MKENPLGRPRRRWVIILKLIFKEKNCGKECFDSDQKGKEWPAVVNTVMNFRAP